MAGLGTDPVGDEHDLEAARRGDSAAFGRLVAPHRRALHAHCYRMLGSLHDAEDALQDALLGAWRGLAGFEGFSPMTPGSRCHPYSPGSTVRPPCETSVVERVFATP